MDGMFFQAKSFNQPLKSWNTSSVTDMSQMFNDATNFNQPLNSWDVSKINTSHQFACNSALSIGNLPERFSKCFSANNKSLETAVG